MEFEKNTLLFGTDPTPRIVAIELGETGTVKVYRREPDGSTVADVEPFHPFVWCDSDVVDLGIESEKLESDLKYGWLVTVDSWKELIALRNGLKNAGRDFFAFTDPVQHYLTATGRTLFKDLPFEELKRLQIEVLSFEDTAAVGGAVAGVGDAGAAVSDRGYSGNHIMGIAVSDNTGWEELLIVDPKNVEESERNALKRLTSLIKERDPDVIEGHDLFRFDLPYLVARAKKSKDETRLGTQRWIPTLAAVPTPNRRKNNRLSKVHSRGPSFRRYLFARAILRRRHAFACRFRTSRCRPAF